MGWSDQALIHTTQKVIQLDILSEETIITNNKKTKTSMCFMINLISRIIDTYNFSPGLTKHWSISLGNNTNQCFIEQIKITSFKIKNVLWDYLWTAYWIMKYCFVYIIYVILNQWIMGHWKYWIINIHWQKKVIRSFNYLFSIKHWIILI